MTNKEILDKLKELNYNNRHEFIIKYNRGLLIEITNCENDGYYQLIFKSNSDYNLISNVYLGLLINLYIDNYIKIHVIKRSYSQKMARSICEISRDYTFKNALFIEYKHLIHKFLKLHKLQYSRYTNNLKSSFNLIDIEFNVITKDLDIEYELKIEGIKKTL